MTAAYIVVFSGLVAQVILAIITVIMSMRMHRVRVKEWEATCEAHRLKGQLDLAEAELADVKADRDAAEELIYTCQRELDELRGLVEVQEHIEKDLRAEVAKANEQIQSFRACPSNAATTSAYFTWKCATCGVSIPTGQHHWCYGGSTWTTTTVGGSTL